MILNIITRTKARPKFFKICYETIHNCIFNKLTLKHWVIYDEDSTLEYLKEYDNIELFKALPCQQQIPNHGKLLHNDYFNQVYKKINNGFIFHMDDDDFISRPDAFLSIEDEILKLNSEDLLIVQFEFAYNNTGPRPANQFYENKEIIQGQIGGSCIICPIDLAKKHSWPPKKCGDLDFIRKINNAARSTYWLKHKIINAYVPGLGQCKDLNEEKWLRHPDIIKHWKNKIKLPTL